MNWDELFERLQEFYEALGCAVEELFDPLHELDEFLRKCAEKAAAYTPPPHFPKPCKHLKGNPHCAGRTCGCQAVAEAWAMRAHTAVTGQ